MSPDLLEAARALRDEVRELRSAVREALLPPHRPGAPSEPSPACIPAKRHAWPAAAPPARGNNAPALLRGIAISRNHTIRAPFMEKTAKRAQSGHKHRPALHHCKG